MEHCVNKLCSKYNYDGGGGGGLGCSKETPGLTVNTRVKLEKLSNLRQKIWNFSMKGF